MKSLFLILSCAVIGCAPKPDGIGLQELLLNVKFPASTEEDMDSTRREIAEYVVKIGGKEIGRIPSKEKISQLFEGLQQEEVLTVTIEALDNTGAIQWQGTHEIDFTTAKTKEFWMEKR